VRRARGVEAFARIALALALALGGGAGCRRASVRARCVVRTSGSYCAFQNVGARAAQGCFVVRVRARPGRAVRAEARVCSGPLPPGEQSAPRPLAFPGQDPFEGCTQDPVNHSLPDCETEVTAERVESL
jgi:hypothetical protein